MSSKYFYFELSRIGREGGIGTEHVARRRTTVSHFAKCDTVLRDSGDRELERNEGTSAKSAKGQRLFRRMYHRGGAEVVEESRRKSETKQGKQRKQGQITRRKLLKHSGPTVRTDYPLPVPAKLPQILRPLRQLSSRQPYFRCRRDLGLLPIFPRLGKNAEKFSKPWNYNELHSMVAHHLFSAHNLCPYAGHTPVIVSSRSPPAGISVPKNPVPMNRPPAASGRGNGEADEPCRANRRSRCNPPVRGGRMPGESK